MIWREWLPCSGWTTHGRPQCLHTLCCYLPYKPTNQPMSISPDWLCPNSPLHTPLPPHSGIVLPCVAQFHVFWFILDHPLYTSLHTHKKKYHNIFMKQRFIHTSLDDYWVVVVPPLSQFCDLYYTLSVDKQLHSGTNHPYIQVSQSVSPLALHSEPENYNIASFVCPTTLLLLLQVVNQVQTHLSAQCNKTFSFYLQLHVTSILIESWSACV